MRKFLLSLVFLSILGYSDLDAQQRKCAANDVMERQISMNPGFAKRMIAIEKQTQEFIAAKRANLNKGKPPGTGGGNGNGGGGNGGGGGGETPPPAVNYNIDVIVHVLYNNTSQNIDLTEINEQIAVLNADFAASNSDHGSYLDPTYSNVLSQETGVSFTLKEVKTVSTNVTAFSTNDAMKFSSSGGSNVVDPANTLNIWVCNLGGGILGYAQFPGGNSQTDGVVVHYTAFGKNNSGPYNLGRTATHEVGHYLNLRHIWGDRRCGNDMVDDTPLHDGPNYGCPQRTTTSNCKGPVTEMWMNYMDYTDDACMNMFSVGQVDRMQAVLATGGARAGLGGTSSTRQLQVKRNDINLNESVPNKKAFQLYPSLTTGTINVQYFSVKSNVAELSIYNSAGIMVAKKRFAVVEGYNSKSFELDNLTNGVYIARLSNNGDVQTQKLVIQH